MVQIQLLGGVHAFDASGAPVDVGPAKCQAVLAALALRPGGVVSVPRLVEMVWGENPPRTAEKTLQSYITRLRKQLGHGSIVRAGAAYRLEVDASAVDVARFQRLLEAGDVEGALAEWSGPPLGGLDAEGLQPTVDGLVEQWLGAIEADMERQVDVDPSAAIGPLTELVARNPFRERLSALLMTALYRAGRQADALATLKATRRKLVEELGVEPGPELRELESRILRQDDDLRGPARVRAETGPVTFGFAEVVDSEQHWVTHPHESAAAMARYEQLMKAVAAGSNGRVFVNRGDACGVAFERADEAARWAREMHAAVGREPWPRGAEVRLRIGLHTGEAQREGGTYFGPAANLATCLAGAAHAGQTILSATTAELIGVSDDLIELGAYRLRGVPSDQRIFQLGAGQHPSIRSADDRRVGNLPRRPGRLIARQDDVLRVDEALASAPVVTLCGPGGIGKTRLAIAAARVCADRGRGGAWFVELARVAAAGDVPRAVADVLGVQESQSRDLTDAVVSALRQRRGLLILDNCEHLIDAAAAFVEEVVDRCEGVRVLATSREGLGLTEERLITVKPLDTASGVELFYERATALDAEFDTHGTRRHVEEICQRLDGVPLAIELAAARTRTMSPADLAERLDSSLRLLTGGHRSGVEHHRTLRAAIEWSYDLLLPSERAVFDRLSVFVGPFDLAAAEDVASDDVVDGVEVEVHLGRLVDQSMVVAEPGPFGRRFRLLESMRQFGAENLGAAGHGESAAARHAGWCVSRVGRIHDLLAGPAEIDGVARLTELWPNLRAAVDWAIGCREGHLARALIAPVAAEVLVRSQTEIADWAERLLAIVPPDDEDLLVFALSLAARRYWRLQDRAGFERLTARYGAPDHPMVHHARALVYQDDEALVRWCPLVAAELRGAGDDHLAQLSDIGVARSLLVLGRFREADEVLAVLLDRYRRHGPPTLLSWMLTMSGYSAAAQGDRALADRLFDESATVELPERTHSRNKPNEALATCRRGDHHRAMRVLRSDVEDLLENENIYDMAGTAVAFIAIMARLGQFAHGARMWGHLERKGLISTHIMRADVDKAVERITTDAAQPVDEHRDLGRQMDERQALSYMRGVLDELTSSPVLQPA